MAPTLIARLAAACLALTAAVGACNLADTARESSDATDTERCNQCQTVLADCASNAANELGYAQCRETWRACLTTGTALSPSTCSNPADKQACELCKTEAKECKSGTAAGPACATQFTSCKSRLMFRKDLQTSCVEDTGTAPTSACKTCQTDLASCLFNGTAAASCSTAFDACRFNASLTAESCKKPAGADGCALCQQKHKECAVTGTESCTSGFGNCKTTLATGVSCELPSTGTGGGGSGGSSGGCGHSACTAGTKLAQSCNSCTAKVCAADAYCCSTEWDASCVTQAKNFPECGCGPAACVHDPCVTGDELVKECSSCVTAICNADSFCCDNQWDSTCVTAAEANPDCACFGGEE